MSGRDTDRDPSTERKPLLKPRTLGGSGGAGGGAADADPCEIIELAPLNSPQAAVVRSLVLNDQLDVRIGGKESRPVLEVHKDGALAGSLTHRGHINIIDCIGAGNAYVAVVVKIDGGFVTVRIQRA